MADMPDPEHIGPYRIERILGAGAMGRVYLARDPIIDRSLAIKVIRLDHGEEAADARSLERFRQEARAAARLHHPGIVSIYQFGEEGGAHHIAMEYVAGRDLRWHLNNGPPFGLADAICVLIQLLDALEYAHGHGVVHRDIKPANLLIAPTGRLKITDFGIARLDASTLTRAATQVRAMIGSPGYMSPEQYAGQPMDRRCDLFAAGVVLYQLLANRLPFVGSDEAVMYQTVHGRTPLLPEHLPFSDTMRIALDNAIAKALAKSPDDRFESAAAFSSALSTLYGAPVPKALPMGERHTDCNVSPGTANVLPGHSAGAATHAPRDDALSEACLQDLEQELARIVGPVAKVLVRRAARHTTELSEVRAALADTISDVTQRHRFLNAPSATTQPRSSGEATSRSATDQRISPEQVDRLIAALTRSHGPIAKVLVMRHARQSRSAADVVHRLCAQLQDEPEAATIAARLHNAIR